MILRCRARFADEPKSSNRDYEYLEVAQILHRHISGEIIRPHTGPRAFVGTSARIRPIKLVASLKSRLLQNSHCVLCEMERIWDLSRGDAQDFQWRPIARRKPSRSACFIASIISAVPRRNTCCT